MCKYVHEFDLDISVNVNISVSVNILDKFQVKKEQMNHGWFD